MVLVDGVPELPLDGEGKVQGLDELEGGGAQVEEPHKAIGRSDRHAGEARIHSEARQRGRAVDAALVHELPPLEIPNFEGSVVAHRDEVVRGLASVKVHRIDLKGVALQPHHEALVVQVVDEDVRVRGRGEPFEAPVRLKVGHEAARRDVERPALRRRPSLLRSVAIFDVPRVNPPPRRGKEPLLDEHVVPPVSRQSSDVDGRDSPSRVARTGQDRLAD